MPVSALTRRLENNQSRLDALARLAQSLHPEAPLKRGFARVTDMAGKTISNVAAANKAGRVGLLFADGAVHAVVETGEAPPPSVKAQKPKSVPNITNQGSLFGE
jgi:exodeoxyribonuclease VII large subunit